MKPNAAPTSSPSARPSMKPTAAPTSSPSARPSMQPNAAPTSSPSARPSMKPTAAPTSLPSDFPSESPIAGTPDSEAEPSSDPDPFYEDLTPTSDAVNVNVAQPTSYPSYHYYSVATI